MRDGKARRQHKKAAKAKRRAKRMEKIRKKADRYANSSFRHVEIQVSQPVAAPLPGLNNRFLNEARQIEEHWRRNVLIFGGVYYAPNPRPTVDTREKVNWKIEGF